LNGELRYELILLKSKEERYIAPGIKIPPSGHELATASLDTVSDERAINQRLVAGRRDGSIGAAMWY